MCIYKCTYMCIYDISLYTLHTYVQTCPNHIHIYMRIHTCIYICIRQISLYTLHTYIQTHQNNIHTDGAGRNQITCTDVYKYTYTYTYSGT